MNNDAVAFETRVQETFPHEVERRTETMLASDGTRLSIGLWIPRGSDTAPTGVVLEAIPYRKDDVSVIDDETRFGYLAGHGIACARLDLRGSGGSTGVLQDEYTPTEQRDIVEVVEWLAGQGWCNGSVGMTGISWSGINALQVAALRPPQLKAIITAGSADDRYDNDVHYLGGAPLAFYMNLWGSALHMMNMRPPMPSVIGETWLEEWTTRLHANPDFTSTWLAHPHRDSYWRQGSVSDDPAAIACPVLLVGGWADNYTDTVFRMLDALPQAQAVVGAWGHTWPERPEPGPGIDFLARCVRWWRQWLLGEDQGVTDDPRLSFYVQDHVPTREDLDFRPGRWWGVDDPRAIVTPRVLPLGAGGRLGGPTPEGAVVTHQSPLDLGTTARHLLPMGEPTDLPVPQDHDDERCLTFDTEPLIGELAILGQVRLHLRVSSSTPTANLTVRLTDVDPDGRSHLVTRGVLNLAHRHGHGPDHVAAVVPGEEMEVDVVLKATAYRFPPGHRVRVAVSTNYWPWLWPAAEQGSVTVALGVSMLELPVLDETSDALVEVDLGDPVIAPPPPVQVERSGHSTWTVATDGARTTVARAPGGSSTVTQPDGWSVTYERNESSYTIEADDPASARMDRLQVQRFVWPEHEVVVGLRTSMMGDDQTFEVMNESWAELDGRVHFRRTTTSTIPRGR